MDSERISCTQTKIILTMIEASTAGLLFHGLDPHPTIIRKICRILTLTGRFGGIIRAANAARTVGIPAMSIALVVLKGNDFGVILRPSFATYLNGQQPSNPTKHDPVKMRTTHDPR